MSTAHDGEGQSGRVIVDGVTFEFDTLSATVEEIATATGLTPPSAHVFVRVDGGACVRLAIDERLALGAAVPKLRSAPLAEPWHVFVDGRRWDWIEPTILESEIREIGDIAGALDLVTEEGRRPLRPGDLLDLSGQAPRVASRTNLPAAPSRGVPIILNGRARELAVADATFEDLVKLAFPNLPAEVGRTFTVTYRRGAGGRPDGSLVPHQAARLAPGAVINVSATDRS